MRTVVLVVLVGLGWNLTACTKPNPEVCCSSRVDCNTIDVDDDERTCAAGLVCLDHACTEPPEAPECTVDTDCTGDTPYCATDQVCVGCTNSEQCTTTDAPICDDMTRACRGCEVDADCESNVCDFETGACIDQSAVVYASPSGSETSTCEKAEPCSIARAFDTANAVRDRVKLAPGTYTASLTITNKRIVVHGFDATVNASTRDALKINGKGHLRAFGLTIVNTLAGSEGGFGILCQSTNTIDTPILYLDRVAVDTEKGAVFVDDCSVTVLRSHVRTRTLGGVSVYPVLAVRTADASIDRSVIDGGAGVGALASLVRVTNSVITNQLEGAFFGNNNGAVIVSFSTIFNSILKCNTSPPSCSGDSLNGVCIDNSIIVNASAGAPMDTVTGIGCTVDYTLIFPQATSVSGANNMLGIEPLLEDPANDDYHLKLGSPAIDAADPSVAGTADLDGTSRPQGPRSDLGAFELTP